MTKEQLYTCSLDHTQILPMVPVQATNGFQMGPGVGSSAERMKYCHVFLLVKCNEDKTGLHRERIVLTGRLSFRRQDLERMVPRQP